MPLCQISSVYKLRMVEQCLVLDLVKLDLAQSQVGLVKVFKVPVPGEWREDLSLLHVLIKDRKIIFREIVPRLRAVALRSHLKVFEAQLLLNIRVVHRGLDHNHEEGHLISFLSVEEALRGIVLPELFAKAFQDTCDALRLNSSEPEGLHYSSEAHL